MLNKFAVATVAASTLATFTLATGAYAATFSTKDVPEIVQAAESNHIRFNRDYRDQPFGATLTLLEITEITWRKGEYRVSFAVSEDHDVDCYVSDPAILERMVDWNKGRKVEVSGMIDKAVIGDLRLNNCVFKEPDRQSSSVEEPPTQSVAEVSRKSFGRR